MSHIFISYSRRNLDFAQKIVEALAVNNLDTWIDWKSIPKGEDWEQEIYRGIEEADAFLFLISPDSVASQMCNKEIDCAVKNGKRILPIVIRDADPKSIHSEISKRNWIFCRERRDEFDAAIEEIRKTIHTDYEWLKYHTELQLKALKWEQKKDASRLLRGKELQEAETILSEIDIEEDPQPTKLQREYILASRINTERMRRQTISGLAMGLAMLLAITIFAVWQWRSAVKQAGISKAREISAQAEIAIQNSYPVRGVLLALESLKIMNQVDAKIPQPEQSLHDALMGLSGYPIANNLGEIRSMLLSQDGRWLAIEDVNAVRLLDMYNLGFSYIPAYQTHCSGRLIFSMNGAWLACPTVEAIRLWDLQNKQVIDLGKQRDIRSISFSPDSLFVAGNQDDGTVFVWDLRESDSDPLVLSNTEIKVITPIPADDLGMLKYSPDGYWLANGVQKTVQLWDLRSKPYKSITLQGHEYLVNSLLFSPNGAWLVTKDLADNAFLWDLRTLTQGPRNLMDEFEAGINSIAFSPASQLVAYGCSDNTIRLLNLDDFTIEPQIIRGHIDDVTAVAFSSNGDMLISGSSDHTVRIWNLSDASKSQILKGHESPIKQLLFDSSSGNRLLSRTTKEIRFWDLDNVLSEPITFREHKYAIEKLIFSPNGKWLVSGSWDTTIRLWKIENSPRPWQMLTEHDDIVTALAFSPNGELLASGSRDKTIRLWNVQETGVSASASYQADGGVDTLVFSPDGKFLASESNSSQVTLWGFHESGDLLPIYLTIQPDIVQTLAFSSNGKWLAVGGKNQRIYLWDMHQLKEPPLLTLNYDAPVDFIAFTPDAHWLFTGGPSSKIKVWEMTNLSSPPFYLQGQTNTFFTITFAVSPHGRWLASGGNQEILIWDLSNIDSQPLVLKNDATVDEIVFDNTESRVASTNLTTNSIYMWNLESPTVGPILLYGPEDSIKTIAFSPDASWLVSGTVNRRDQVQLNLWHVNINDLHSLACQLAGRNLTYVEWQQYFPGEEYRLTCPQWPAGE